MAANTAKFAALFLLPAWLPLCLFALFFGKLSTYCRKKAGLRPRLVWGPIPLITNKYLSRAMHLKGYDSESVTWGLYSITEKSDFDVVFSKNKFEEWLFAYFLCYFVFLYALLKYDIFNYTFDGGFLRNTPLIFLETHLLHIASKKLVVMGYGGDVVMPSKSKGPKDYEKRWRYHYDVDEKKIASRVNHFCSYADYIIVCGDMVDFVPRIDACFSYLTIDLNEIKPIYPKPHKPLYVVHASNHRQLKGTDLIIKEISKLSPSDFKFEIVENKLNKDAFIIYSKADIIVEQMILGYYGLFAIEAMALGKPVMTMMRKDLYKYYGREWADCPIIPITRNNLHVKLKKLASKPELINRLGKLSRKYVEKYHSYEYIGKRFDEIYSTLW
ncbi:MAG: hypothetical protein ACP5IG_04845 [Candidatus Micrarchaeia archaeon]